jgi:hypothetical protein
MDPKPHILLAERQDGVISNARLLELWRVTARHLDSAQEADLRARLDVTPTGGRKARPTFPTQG